MPTKHMVPVLAIIAALFLVSTSVSSAETRRQTPTPTPTLIASPTATPIPTTGPVDLPPPPLRGAMLLHATLPVPGGTRVHIEGLKGGTTASVRCLTADTESVGDPSTSLLAAVIPASCPETSGTSVFRIVVNGLVSAPFQFQPDEVVDLGTVALVQPTPEPRLPPTGSGPSGSDGARVWPLSAALGLAVVAVGAVSAWHARRRWLR